jgi:hypothetical protein
MAYTSLTWYSFTFSNPTAPARGVLDPNEDRIIELEDSARQHRVDMAAMKIRLLSAEQRLDDILSGRVAIPNSVQAADTEHAASVEEVPLPLAQPPSQPMQALVVSSSEIEDGK